MKNRLKFFFCLFAVGFLCVACSTRPAEPSKPVPVVQVTTKEVATPPASSKTPPATVPVADKKPKASATDTASTPAKKEEVNETEVTASKKNPAKAQKSDVPAAPKAPLKKEEKKDVPATEKQPEPSVSEKVETPASPASAPETKSIKFRCTFWMKPQKSYDIYVRTKGEFHRCQLFELVFSQEMTPDVDEKGMVTVYRKTDGDFVPLFTIDTCGIDNLGAILLPKFNPEDPQGAYIQVLDLDEKKFPKGSLRVLNWAHKEVIGDVLFRHCGTRQAFTLKCGEYFSSAPISKNREICEYRFFDPENPSRTIFSSALSLFDWNQTMLFVLKNETGDGFDFKVCKVR